MLVDTDVLIWHLRGYAQATRRLDELGDHHAVGARGVAAPLAA